MTTRGWASIIPVLWLSLSLAAQAALAQTPEALARTLREKPSPAAKSALAQYAKVHAKEQNGALADLALAFHELEAKAPDRALALLKTLEGRLPKLRDYVQFFEAQSLAALERQKDAAKAALAVTNSPVETRAVALAVTALGQSGGAAQALEQVRARLTRLEAPLGTLALGEALEATGDAAGAAAAFKSVYVKYPRAAEAQAASHGMDRLGVALSAEERFTRGNVLLELNDGAAARVEFQAAAAGLTGEERSLALVRAAAGQFKAGMSASALTTLEGLEATGEADAERLYWAVQAARRGRQYVAMKALGQKLIRAHQTSRWRAEALLTIANQEMLDEEAGQPQRYFEACAATQVESLTVAHCAWRVAFAAHLARRPDAFSLLTAFVNKYSASPHVSAAVYYLGRLSESKSITDAASYYLRASTSFPNHYYGVLARARLTAAAFRNITAQPAYEDARFAAPPAANFEPDAETKLRAERAQMLTSAGLDDYAERELRFHLRGGGPAHLVAQSLAQLASRKGDHGRAVRLIKGLFPGYLALPIDKAPAAFWKLAYPMPYRESLERYARSHDLDPFLVAGLIRQESEFNPRAISRSKALGLMQVMPATGRELAKKTGVSRFTNAMLFDPEVSLKFGTYHFRKWLDAEQGRIEVTLAAYNAGKTRADRWIKRHEFREPAEFIETIPFLETRDYVQSVLRNADFYRRLYGAPAR